MLPDPVLYLVPSSLKFNELFSKFFFFFNRPVDKGL